MSIRILHLDIEMAPSLATVWGLFNQNISIDQLIGDSEVLTWVAKWDGEPGVLTGSLVADGRKRMLKRIHRLIDEADAVVTWNGNGFDLKVLNKDFLLLGLSPPAPAKSIDLLQTSRTRFRFTSNKMDYVARKLGLKGKKKHRGHQLWLDCMNRKKSAFAEMMAYNKQDVVILEGIYKRFKPWITNHPHPALYTKDEAPVCRICGSSAMTKRGKAPTTVGLYQRYQCECGAWSRGSTNLLTPAKRKAMLRT